jgi:hypothetical protein
MNRLTDQELAAQLAQAMPMMGSGKRGANESNKLVPDRPRRLPSTPMISMDVWCIQ